MIDKYLNTIVNGDCLSVMRSMPDESVNIIITSPPFNILNTTGGGMKASYKSKKWANAELRNGYDGYNDNMPHELYVKWQRECLTEMMRLIPNDGAIFYNHKWRVQNGLIQDRADIMEGFPVRQIIIIQRAGGLNFNDGYFLPTYEVVYLICKPKFKLIKGANGLGDVWKINQIKYKDHPAPFNVELPDKIIKSTSAQIILDPFMGSGTTAIAALKNNRSFIGIEQSQKYVDVANKRIADFIDERDNPAQLPLIKESA